MRYNCTRMKNHKSRESINMSELKKASAWCCWSYKRSSGEHKDRASIPWLSRASPKTAGWSQSSYHLHARSSGHFQAYSQPVQKTWEICFTCTTMQYILWWEILLKPKIRRTSTKAVEAMMKTNEPEKHYPTTISIPRDSQKSACNCLRLHIHWTRLRHDKNAANHAEKQPINST